MITAIFFKNSHGIYRGFSISGHAGYADKGQDIVCAAVSALSVNTANSIEALTDDRFDAAVNEKTGQLSFHFADGEVSGESQLFIKSLILGLEGISSEYKDKQYIQIVFKEV